MSENEYLSMFSRWNLSRNPFDVNPIERELFTDIYEASGGSLRETFNICGKLCIAVAGDQLFKTITGDEAGPLCVGRRRRPFGFY